MDFVYGVIKVCVKRELFDKSMYEKYGVLTSTRMQRTYLWATKDLRRKGTEVEMIAEYFMLGEQIVNEAVNLTLVAGKSSVFRGKPPTFPAHKIKEEKIKEEKKTTVSPSAPPIDKSGNKSTKDDVEPFWTEMVECYSGFIEKNFPGEKINWSYKVGDNRKRTREPLLFKQLVQKLRNRCENIRKKEWTLKYALDSLQFYLDKAHEEEWFKNHFSLKNLVEHFDPIFRRVAAEEKEKKETAAKTKAKINGNNNSLNDEINYLMGRFVEGNLDTKLITEDHYNRLVTHNHIPVNALKDCEGETILDKQRSAVIKFFNSTKTK